MADAAPTPTAPAASGLARPAPLAPRGAVPPPAPKVSPAERAAALLLALGPDVSAAVLKLVTPGAVESLAKSARALQKAPAEAVDVVAQLFVNEMESFGKGPLTRDIALQAIVGKALGEDATRILQPPRSASPTHPAVQSINEAEAGDLALLLRKEQPMTAALVLSMLPPEKSALVVKKMPEAMRAPIVRSVFSMNAVAPDVVDGVLRGLAEQVRAFLKAGKRTAIDGRAAGLSIMRGLAADDQRALLSELEKKDNKLADEIRGKLVSFEEIAKLTRKEIQLFLQNADMKLLAVALRGATPHVVDTLLANMSQRAAEGFREEMEAVGRLRLSQIEAAQADLVKVVLRLAEEGKVVLPGQTEKML
jgi:flagellar motor switch protein FliG